MKMAIFRAEVGKKVKNKILFLFQITTWMSEGLLNKV
jgi:hypothetical protein